MLYTSEILHMLASSRQFVSRLGIKKLILVIDGSWNDGHIGTRSKAGWDQILCPDEMDKRAKAIV